MNCPHCHAPYGEKVHVCADTERWTQAERDTWRQQARKRHPWIQFAPSTARVQDLFGARNRADKEAQGWGTSPQGGVEVDYDKP